MALVSLGVGFLAAFLGAVFFAAGFAAVFFSGAAEADLADFLATDFLAGAFFFVAGFAAVFFGDALLAAGFLTAFSTGFLDGGLVFFSSRQSPWIAREFWPFWPMPFLWLFFSLRFFWFVLLPFRLSRSVEDALHPMTQEEVLHGTQDSPEVFHKSSGLSIDYSSF